MSSRLQIGKLIALLLLFLATATTSFAQQLDHVQGQIMVQMAKQPANQTLKSWFLNFEGRSGNKIKLEYQKVLSRPVNIHLLSFDFTTHNEKEVLAELRRHPMVAEAQFNHFVKNRAIPNDPEFGNQWQYINTGQGGGTVGADLDADLAWDITTGGVTANGDTIVACIIDDGIDASHPDMAPNLWVNHAEIPNNGIDDDNNGYIDDYKGWDTEANDDSVDDDGFHGTPVAGIIGARGNDNFGVAGVNWNMKLMIVQGGTGVESEVIAAYSYPLEARKRYNETNGEQGAFVVATNASWGVDFGQAADAPLWCAFYDTLGTHGIVSCGATINGDVNVDEQGDLPTTCPSDYLIGVTNMTRFDVKRDIAGYGAISVDLGAFGEETWTVASGGGFAGFGGTSGATPHVTGLVALLYSLPCPDFMNLVRENPSEAASLVRTAVLEGVDQNASLQGITSTGGRMNMYKSLRYLLDRCQDGSGCPRPVSSDAVVNSDSTVMITYGFLNDTINAQVNMRYRAVGDTVWTNVDSVSSPFTLSDLRTCVDYEYQFQAVCDTITTEYTRAYNFTSAGCCENPSSITTTIQDSSITFNWTPIDVFQSYELETRLQGTEEWTVNSTTDTSFLLGNLAPCTLIEYRFRVICSDTTASDYTDVTLLRTNNCGSCIEQEYCAPPELSTSDEWIADVMVGGLSNTSQGAGGGTGYADFTFGGPTTTMQRGAAYPFALTPGYFADAFNEGWAIFIDFNQNGSFDDEGEGVFIADSVRSTAVTGTINIPVDAIEGFTRMRIAMLWNSIPNGCASTADGFGEVEDYCVTIEGLAACNIPDGLVQINANAANDSTATMSWNSTDASEYGLRYRVENTTDWLEVILTDTTHELTGLDSCTTYEAQVLSRCTSENLSDYSASVFFTTACISSVRFPEIGLESWTVAPNPVSQQTTVRYSFATSPAKVGVRLFSQYGRELQYQETTGSANGNVSLDMGNLPAGVYYLRLETDKGNSRVRKVIKF